MHGFFFCSNINVAQCVAVAILVHFSISTSISIADCTPTLFIILGDILNHQCDFDRDFNLLTVDFYFIRNKLIFPLSHIQNQLNSNSYGISHQNILDAVIEFTDNIGIKSLPVHSGWNVCALF